MAALPRGTYGHADNDSDTGAQRARQPYFAVAEGVRDQRGASPTVRREIQHFIPRVVNLVLVKSNSYPPRVVNPPNINNYPIPFLIHTRNDVPKNRIGPDSQPDRAVDAPLPSARRDAAHRCHALHRPTAAVNLEQWMARGMPVFPPE